jgi:hypothetical protein
MMCVVSPGQDKLFGPQIGTAELQTLSEHGAGPSFSIYNLPAGNDWHRRGEMLADESRTYHCAK